MFEYGPCSVRVRVLCKYQTNRVFVRQLFLLLYVISLKGRRFDFRKDSHVEDLRNSNRVTEIFWHDCDTLSMNSGLGEGLPKFDVNVLHNLLSSNNSLRLQTSIIDACARQRCTHSPCHGQVPEQHFGALLVFHDFPQS